MGERLKEIQAYVGLFQDDKKDDSLRWMTPTPRSNVVESKGLWREGERVHSRFSFSRCLGWLSVCHFPMFIYIITTTISTILYLGMADDF